MTNAQMQLGKNGVTENFIETLKSYFKKHKNVKISVLKSARKDKAELKEIEIKIAKKLGLNYHTRSIGYTIAIKKLGKDKT